MPVFYHVDGHGHTPRPVMRRRRPRPLFFGPADGPFSNMFKQYGMSEHGGYVVYEVKIPSRLYTDSMNPRTKKVVRVTPRNVAKYREFATETSERGFNTTMMMPRYSNILGFDLTRMSTRHQRKRDKGAMGAEGWLYEIPKEIKITKHAVFSAACREHYEERHPRTKST